MLLKIIYILDQINQHLEYNTKSGCHARKNENVATLCCFLTLVFFFFAQTQVIQLDFLSQQMVLAEAFSFTQHIKPSGSNQPPFSLLMNAHRFSTGLAILTVKTG